MQGIEASMNDKTFFQDKVVVITGASSGIGREAALAIARLNAKVVLAARNGEKLKSLEEEIRGKGGKALAVTTDVSVFAETQRMAAEAISKWGQIDMLIANAGKYIQDVSWEIDIQSFEQSMALNFMGTLHAVKSVLPGMRHAGNGHIVIMNSLDAKKGIIGDGPYVAAKAALDGFGDVLRQELKPAGIRVTSVYPARVDTPMLGNLQVPRISPKIPPGKVVRAMIRGIKRNKAIVVVPSAFFLLGSINGMFPRLSDWAYRILKIEGKRMDQ
jgi:NAD(P)-dependent dehydrogenase (short-subunit alcohol dehydrogenase family)